MSENIHVEFLQMLGFEGAELSVFLPKWKCCAKSIGLTDEDVEFATREWIPQYWDVSLKGVQKGIAAYIRELVEVSRMAEYKENGAKIIYGINPSHPASFLANKISGGDKVQIAFPDFVLRSVLTAFFNKGDMFVDDQSVLNSKCAHCGLNCTRINAFQQGKITAPDILWSWAMMCNEAPKTDEMIQCMFDPEWQFVMSTLPHDALLGTIEAEDEMRVFYLAEEIRSGLEVVSEATGVRVTDEHIREAIDQYMTYMNKVSRLEELVARSDPQPVMANDLTIFLAANHTAFTLGYKYLNEAIDIMIEEVSQRIADKIGTLPIGSPKLGCHFTPHCVPWINKAFLDNGINISVGTFFARNIKKEYHPGEDIYKTIARQWLNNPSVVNFKNEVDIICEKLESFPLDGMLYGFFSFDRWLGMHQKLMVQLLEERTGIPHFYLEGNFWSDSDFNIEGRIGRIQNISYSLKMDRMLADFTSN